MPLEQSLWIPQLKEKLYPLNDFMKQSVDESAFIQGKQVVRAVEGDNPTVLLNSRGEVAAGNLNDVENTYAMNNMRTTTTLVEDVEEIELAYDKRGSIVQRHAKQLNLKGTNFLAYLWSASLASNIVRTTGTAAPALLTGATGSRNKLTIEDFIKAVSIMGDMDTDPKGRNVLMPETMYTQFLIDNKTNLLDLSKYGKATLQDGDLQMLFGIQIWRRGKKNLPRYSSAATPVPISPFAVGAATDNAAAIFWHKEEVASAIGGFKMYATPSAKSQGDEISARIRIGGQIMQSDQTGVVSIVETV